MISTAIRRELADHAAWLDEAGGPLEPRNIYGVTKLAGEQLCRLAHLENGLNCIVLRTSRFLPEEDDTHRALSGENMKANELLHRRLTVEDAARAHIIALDRAPEIGFGNFIVSAPTPFAPEECEELKRDAATVITRHFPDAPALYTAKGWELPGSIGRVYDAAQAEQVLGFRCETDFRSVLEALKNGDILPFVHDPSYSSPKEGPGTRTT